VRVGAVVVSHESAADLPGCLEALLVQEPPPRVIVVDNGSSDGSARLVRERFGSRVELLDLPGNTGFSGGCNRGYAALGAVDAVATVNPDVRLRPGALAAAARCLEARPRAGAAAPLLVREDGATVDSAGQCLAPWTLEVRDLGYGRPLVPALETPRPVLAACGAFAVYRRAALEAVREDAGPWAESFFCFWEDLELGWRLWNRGWEVWRCPEALAVHRRGGGAPPGTGPLRWRRPARLEAMVLANKWATLARHLAALDLLPRLPVLLAWDLAAAAAGVMRRPALALHLARRLPLVAREWARRGRWPRRRLRELPC